MPMNRSVWVRAAFAFVASLLLASFSRSAFADVATFRDGENGYAGTDDTFLVQDGTRDSTNWGGRPDAYVGTFAGGPSADEVNRSLVRFNVFSLAGRYEQITRITLTLNVLDASGVANFVELRQPIEANGDWIEGVQNGFPESEAASWSNKQHPSFAWIGGPGLGETGVGPVLASAPYDETTNGIFDLVITDPVVATALIDDFISVPNEGFLLRSSDEIPGLERNDLIFCTSEHGVFGDRPLLTVEYTPAPEPELVALVGAGVLAVAGRVDALRRARTRAFGSRRRRSFRGPGTTASLRGLFLMLWLVLPSVARAELFVNGSFETPLVPVGSFTNFAGGSTAISGWRVVGIDSAVVSGTFTQSGILFRAQDGNQFVDLAGVTSNSTTSGVTQTVPTTVGQAYRLRFQVGSAQGGGFFFPSTIDVSVNDGPRVSHTNPATPSNALDWMAFSLSFVATTPTTKITFYNGGASNNFNSSLDGASLEAESTAVPGLGMPGGVALLVALGCLAISTFGVAARGSRAILRRAR